MGTIEYAFERKRLGQLDCGIVRPRPTEAQPRSLVVLCHGYGAGGDDLVGLAPEILQIAPLEAPTMMVFPAAPLTLDDEGIPGGRAWWKLSIQRLLDAIDAGQYERVREEEPPGIDAARSLLSEVVTAALDESKLDESRLILGGFSQGAMLSMDTACRGLVHPPACMLLFSACLVCEKHWRLGAKRLKDTQIMQSHGRIDPILPLQTGKWLTELLEEAGCSVDYIEFDGVHTIPVEAIEQAAQFLAKITNEP